MKHYVGLDGGQLFGSPVQQTVVAYDTDKVLNSHALICGMSGTGKSYQCVSLMRSAAESGVEMDIFDVHGELGDICFEVDDKGNRLKPIPARRGVKYSQATMLGYNPLVLDTDPHTGGIIRQIDKLLMLINGVAPLGIKQEACLRHLVTDTYESFGIFQSDPSTWVRRQLTEAEHERILNSGKRAALRDYYPSLVDLRLLAEKKMTSLAIGGDDSAAAAFAEVSKCMRALNRATSKFARNAGAEDAHVLEGALEQAKQKYIDATQVWVSSLRTGKELSEIMKYTSADVLSGVLNRLDSLNSTGIFRANQPPFKDAKVRVHDITALGDEHQILFVRLRLREIFDRRRREGATRSGTELRHVIFIDEGHKFFGGGSGEADIVGIIAKEARKFGIGLWVASQSPVDFPKSFLTNVGMTMLLGIHPGYWSNSKSLLRISEETLHRIKAKEILALKLQVAGEGDPEFHTVVVPNRNNRFGTMSLVHKDKWLNSLKRAA